MFGYYLKTLFRSLWKRKMFPLINIIGLAFAFAAGLLILMWVTEQLRYDRFHENAENIYRLNQRQEFSGSSKDIAVTMAPLAKTVKDHFPPVEKATRFLQSPEMMVQAGEDNYIEKFAMADPDFFRMFSFKFLEGSPGHCFRNEKSVVLSRDAAKRFFGSVEQAEGKLINIDEKDHFKVTGIIENIPEYSHLKFDMIIPLVNLEMMGNDLSSWGNNSFYTYVELKPGADIEKLEKEIYRHIDGLMEEDSPTRKIYIQPLKRVYLYSNYNYEISGLGDINNVLIFSAIGLLIIIIAAINFINLSTAQFSHRSLEVGIKKVAGAERSMLLRQYIGESVIISIMAGIVAIGIVELILPLFNSYLDESFQLALIFTYPIVLIFVFIVVVTGVLAGSYPAFVLSSYNPVEVLNSRRHKSSKSNLRKALVVIQFFFSSALITSSIIVMSQIAYMNSPDHGYDIKKLLQVRLHGDLKDKYKLLEKEYSKLPQVEALTVLQTKPTDTRSAVGGFRWRESAETTDRMVYRMRAGYNVVEAMGLKLISGEDFSRKAGHKPGKNFIINREMAELYPGDNALGAKMIFSEDTGKVVGIVENFHHQSMREKIGPLVISIIRGDYDYLILRADVFTEDYQSLVNSVEDKWKDIFPHHPFNAKPVLSENVKLYEQDIRLMAIFIHFTFLAILIAIIGLFGLATYMTNQRFKEIAIRKVLGASYHGLMLKLTKEYFWLILIANLLAAPLTYFVMSRWMQEFYYSTEISWQPFLISLVITMVFGLLAVFFRTWKAVRKTPVDAIKYE